MGRIDKKGGLDNQFFGGGDNGSNEESPKSTSTLYTPDLTHEEAFTAFSGVNLADARKQIKVEYINIDTIQPDRAQPRRTVPLRVRQGEHVTAQNIVSLFEYWLNLINTEREQPIELEKYLTSEQWTQRGDAVWEEDNQPVPEVPFEQEANNDRPIEAAFLRIVALAASIRAVGLMNPITVAPLDVMAGTYMIETGERRWLAYHLLRWQFGEEDETEARGKLRWDAIPAIKVEAADVWRQATENNARDNLNAIGKARQLGLLLMHMHNPKNFQPIDAFEHEQDFYAQVADGNQFRVIRNKSEQLIGALNLKSAKQIRDYRRLLRIDHDLWDAADDGDWTEGTIRNIISGKTDSVPNGTVSMNQLDNAVGSDDSVPDGTVSVPEHLKPLTILEKKYNEKKLARMTSEERQELVDELNSLTKHIKQLVKKFDE